MTRNSPSRRRIPRGLVAKVAVVSALCTLLYWVGCSLYWAGLSAYVGREFQQDLKEFPKRHLEATQAIERAYAHLRENGSWPTKTEFERAGQRWLPPEWKYESDPDQGGPCIFLFGPWHMILTYRFAPPQHGEVDNTWTLSVEGDKRTFPADAVYSLKSAPEPHRP